MDNKLANAAKIQISLQLYDVSVTYDTCATTKRIHGACTEQLDQGSRLRSNHTLQRQCLEGPPDVTGRQLYQCQHHASIDGCMEWCQCLANAMGDDYISGFDALTKILEGLTLIQKHTGLLRADARSSRGGGCPGLPSSLGGVDEPDPQTCVDPRLMDVEEFECNCLDRLRDTAGSGVDFETQLAQQINSVACNHPRVCCHWKDDHCNGTGLLESLASRSTSSQQGRENQIGEDKALDKAISGKCD